MSLQKTWDTVNIVENGKTYAWVYVSIVLSKIALDQVAHSKDWFIAVKAENKSGKTQLTKWRTAKSNVTVIKGFVQTENTP